VSIGYGLRGRGTTLHVTSKFTASFTPPHPEYGDSTPLQILMNKKKVKQYHYMSGQTLRVPGG